MISIRTDLSFTEFDKILASAFLPYTCSFSSISNGAGFSFAIYEGEVGILQVTHAKKRNITDKHARSIIAQARRHLRSQGVVLIPWKFPERATVAT
jgi:hypothetical protein